MALKNPNDVRGTLEEMGASVSGSRMWIKEPGKKICECATLVDGKWEPTKDFEHVFNKRDQETKKEEIKAEKTAKPKEPDDMPSLGEVLDDKPAPKKKTAKKVESK